VFVFISTTINVDVTEGVKLLTGVVKGLGIGVNVPVEVRLGVWVKIKLGVKVAV
jgi:hypothetical protein